MDKIEKNGGTSTDRCTGTGTIIPVIEIVQNTSENNKLKPK